MNGRMRVRLVIQHAGQLRCLVNRISGAVFAVYMCGDGGSGVFSRIHVKPTGQAVCVCVCVCSYGNNAAENRPQVIPCNSELHSCCRLVDTITLHAKEGAAPAL